MLHRLQDIPSYLYANTLKHVVHFLSLRRGNCKRQLSDGSDNMVCIFTSKVQHQGDTVHPLWALSIKVVNTESSSPRPALRRPGTQSKRYGRTVSGLSDRSQPRHEGSIFQEPKHKCVYIFLTHLPNYILKWTSSESVYMSASGFQILCLTWFDYIVTNVWQVNPASFCLVFVWLFCQNSTWCSSSSNFSCKINCVRQSVLYLFSCGDIVRGVP